MKRPLLDEVMNNHFMDRLRQPELAKLAHCSLTLFKREFKNRFGTTPGKWILEKRIDLAAGLLESSRLSVAQVARHCGFENQTHFSRVFREKKGCSPLRFRQERKAGRYGKTNSSFNINPYQVED